MYLSSREKERGMQTRAWNGTVVAPSIYLAHFHRSHTATCRHNALSPAPQWPCCMAMPLPAPCYLSLNETDHCSYPPHSSSGIHSWCQVGNWEYTRTDSSRKYECEPATMYSNSIISSGHERAQDDANTCCLAFYTPGSHTVGLFWCCQYLAGQ